MEKDDQPDPLDYPLSMANERTFLAWIRTALALLAGGVALDQLAPDLAPAPVRTALAMALALGGAVLGVASYRRWAQTERAMEAGDPLPTGHIMLVLTICVVAAAVVFSVLLVGWSR
ncbi:YidH family protein [Kitasatospora sp. NPDC004531]